MLRPGGGFRIIITVRRQGPCPALVLRQLPGQQERAVNRAHRIGDPLRAGSARPTALALAFVSLILLAVPAAADIPVPPGPTPSPCGLLGGLTLSLMFVACGCWAVRSQWRSRR